MLETGAFVTGACVATAVPPVDRRFGIVDGACETGAVLSADPADGAVMVACLGRLVNLRWSERASGWAGTGAVGATVPGSPDRKSESWRWIRLWWRAGCCSAADRRDAAQISSSPSSKHMRMKWERRKSCWCEDFTGVFPQAETRLAW